LANPITLALGELSNPLARPELQFRYLCGAARTRCGSIAAIEFDDESRTGDNCAVGRRLCSNEELTMFRNRAMTVLLAGIVLAVLGAAFAAPPKSTSSKKKPADSAKTAKEDAADSKTGARDGASDTDADDDGEPKKVVKTDAEWRKILTPMQFRVARKKGTEPAFGRDYNKFKKEGDGTYVCVCCGQPLFESKTKFESATGWPSFYAPIDEKAVTYLDDTSENLIRTEVECSRCDGHLGHVFPDGPEPTFKRYCMNYASLKFVRKGAADKGTKAKDAKGKGSKSEDSD
jgi:peptide-methionine (R)-S-oxide reductase